MKKFTLDDILNNDEFGLLDSEIVKPETSIKTDEDRLKESFEEINVFFEKNNREPSSNSMTEFSLYKRLENFRTNEKHKITLKPLDKHNLLGEVQVQKEVSSIDDILNSDAFDLLGTDADLSIHTFKHTPKVDKRAEAEYISKRKPMPEKEFAKYEPMFQQVHKDLKSGKRKLLPFYDAETNLKQGHFYLVDGLLAYLEVSKAEKVLKENKSGDRVRLDGRTVTIFENATISNMLFRSLGKIILKNGKLVTNTDDDINNELLTNSNTVNEEDISSGWIYVLKSKSEKPEISNLKNLYKIGFSTIKVEERIKNANNEATYLFADVEIVATWKCYNMNTQKFEHLIHRFFAESCLNIDVFDKNQRITPREWFIVPLQVINEVIELIISEKIMNYKYDNEQQMIIEK